MTVFLRSLIGTTALVFAGLAPGWAQEPNSTAPPVAGGAGGEGFAISIDGVTIAGSPVVAGAARRVDVAVEAADLDVRFDGLGAVPRLDLEVTRETGPRRRVTLQSRLNYPAFVERAEMRLIRLDGRGGRETIGVYPVAPNGQVAVPLPFGEGNYAVHRVYDARGRYDETAPLSLTEPDRRGLVEGVEDGSDFTARRRIPVRGGAVTVSGTGLAPGSTVRTLGTQVSAARDGGFVVQRILPPGTYPVPVQINGGQPLRIVRDVQIPEREWFGVGVADMTLGWRGGGTEANETYARGRISGYGKVHTAGGLTITGSIDTSERDFEDIFSSFERKSPTALLRRLDPYEFYPTYGDDSAAFEDAPTDGAVYLRVEKDGNYAMWGTGTAPLAGSHYLRNERTLYGFHGLYRSQDVTSEGEPRLTFEGYVAQPDRLPGRDVFRGTGGSIYFLSRQDIAVGTETLRVEIRDGVTGRVLSTELLTPGEDYNFNYTQGVVTLSRPLSGFVSEGPISGGAGSDPVANLTVQYEFTPLTGDLDGMTYGARTEAWVTNRLRLGITGQVERTADADQTAESVDLLFRLSDETELELEYSRSEGPGFDSTFSADGGLTLVTQPSSGGTGEALRFSGRAALSNLGIASDGRVSGYFEKRTEGFTTLDYATTDATGDETFWGLAGEVPVAAHATLNFVYDSYENEVNEHERVGTVELVIARDPTTELSFALEHTDKSRGTETGRRTDAAVRLTQTLSEDREWYVFGQATLDRAGLEKNHRVGIGGRFRLGPEWTVEGEVSGGSLGAGARLMAERESEGGGSAYFGYELDPGREIAGGSRTGRDRGRIVSGGREPISDTVSVYGENTYDMFGSYRSLVSQYGIDYTPSTELSYSASVEVGTVRDDVNGNFERRGVSLGMRYDDGAALVLRGRLEYREDLRNNPATLGGSRTYLVSLDGQYKIDEARRLVFAVEHADTDTDNSTVAEGRLTDVNLGYAVRPVDKDRFNLIARYRYLYDDYGQRIDGTEEPGPRQRSHIFSADGEYQLSPRWSLGGKLGFRVSETAADADSPFIDNDAFLAVMTARYHMTHQWDSIVELRRFDAADAGFGEQGFLVAVYRHISKHAKIGVGYNFTSFSDDLSDLTLDDQGLFLNIIAKF